MTGQDKLQKNQDSQGEERQECSGVSRLREMVEKAGREEQERFDSYMKDINETYKLLPVGSRAGFLASLSKTANANWVESARLFGGFEGFNPKCAREIRERLGINQPTLARQLRIDQPYISSFESGRVPKNINNPRVQKYLKWLKEKGYNPFGI